MRPLSRRLLPTTSFADNQRAADMIHLFVYPFLPYRSFFFPFLVMSAIGVPCWLVFRLYRLQAPGHGLSFHREILLLTFVVYLCGLGTATLIPNHNSRLAAEAAVGIELHPNLASLTCSSTTLPRGSTARAFCLHRTHSSASAENTRGA
jgi:hypothetical protein